MPIPFSLAPFLFPLDAPSAHFVRRARTALLAVALGGLACAGGPEPGQAGYPFNVDGTYTGSVFFDGDPFDATLEAETGRGGAVRGTFRVRSPVSIQGQVEGTVVDHLLRLSITYRSPGGCDGSMEGVLTITEGGGILEGPVTVRDCGDPVPARLALRRGGDGPIQGGT